jgi:hypothetical protein
MTECGGLELGGEGRVSREEAVEAYTAGRISRRTFIRHLVAAGVSVGAAVTYAEVLSPGGASQISGRGTGGDYGDYGDYDDYAQPPVEPGAGEAGAVRPPSEARPPTPVRERPRFTR